MPRVIAGCCGGIPLEAPKGKHTRPTTDKVKEALFSILQAKLNDANFLDLFAGCGQNGIEAVSRGAKKAYLLEENKACQLVIQKNLQKTQLTDKINLIRGDVLKGLRRLGIDEISFSIIYMDPPYDLVQNYLQKSIPIIQEYKMLENGGVLIVEHRSSDKLDENVMNLKLYRCCKYGSSMLTFYINKS